MEDIYKNILLTIDSLTALSTTTNELKEKPSEEKAEEIVTIVDNCENNFLKVKEEIVKMIKELEDDANNDIDENKDKEIKIKVQQTNNGFLIKE